MQVINCKRGTLSGIFPFRDHWLGQVYISSLSAKGLCQFGEQEAEQCSAEEHFPAACVTSVLPVSRLSRMLFPAGHPELAQASTALGLSCAGEV